MMVAAALCAPRLCPLFEHDPSCLLSKGCLNLPKRKCMLGSRHIKVRRHPARGTPHQNPSYSPISSSRKPIRSTQAVPRLTISVATQSLSLSTTIITMDSLVCLLIRSSPDHTHQ